MLTILTYKPNIFNRIKYLIKSILGKNRGPESVALSEVSGLSEIGVDFNVNPNIRNIKEIVHVVSDHNALSWAIDLKKSGRVKKIIAGPSISILPTDHAEILYNENIDTIVFPTQWPKDFFVSKDPYFEDKIKIWSAGVSPKIHNKLQKKYDFLIYQKNITDDIVDQISSILNKRKLKFKILKYGEFKKEDYYEFLNCSEFLIYLSLSESQGIALNEAWMCDVPSLVLSNDVWRYKEHEWKDGKINAPLLTKETGLFFTMETLDLLLEDLGNMHFCPRDYSLNHFSDTISAQNLVNIIKNVK